MANLDGAVAAANSFGVSGRERIRHGLLRLIEVASYRLRFGPVLLQTRLRSRNELGRDSGLCCYGTLGFQRFLRSDLGASGFPVLNALPKSKEECEARHKPE